MLGSAQLGARLGSQLGLRWGFARESGSGLAWLRAQLGSLVLTWCLGSAQGSARLGSPAWLEAWGSAQVSALRTLTLIKVWLDSSRFFK